MIGKLSLTEQLAECEVGVPREVTVLVTPTRNDVGAFESDVDEMVGYEHEESPESRSDVPMQKQMKGAAPAVAIVIGKGNGK